jgi:hypothetical protein
MQRGFWRRHAWKFLFGLAMVIALFGIGDVVMGVSADPAIPRAVAGLTIDEMRATSPPMFDLVDLQVRAGGLHLIVIGLLWGAILLVPFRRGERWAWFAMWTFPAWGLVVSVSFLFVDLVPDAAPPPPAVSGWVFFALTAALLLAAVGGVPGRDGFGEKASPAGAESGGDIR